MVGGYAGGYGVGYGAGCGVGTGIWGIGAVIVGTLILIAIIAVFSFGGGFLG